MTSVYSVQSGIYGSGPFLEPVQLCEGETRHLTNSLLTAVEHFTGKVHPLSLCFNSWWEGLVLRLLHHFVHLARTKQLLLNTFAVMHHSHHQTQLELATS